MTKHLIIIPGIGDDNVAYHIGARVFTWLGFTSRVHVFGWDSSDATSYTQRINALNVVVTSIEGDVYLLGVSAGGSAAVNCLGMLPDKVQKVVALCSPLNHFDTKINPLLELSIKHTEAHLAAMSPETKQRILSLHALWDTVVPIRLSKPAGVHERTLPAILHPITIFFGLTILAPVSARFFKQR